MTELIVPPAGSEPAVATDERSPRKPVLVAAFLSTLIPGAGQLLLKQPRKAFIFLGLFLSLFVLYWPARFPAHWGALAAMVWGGFGLCTFAGSYTLLRPGTETSRNYRWWLLAIVPVGIAAGALHANWMLLVSGFRSSIVSSRSMEPTMFKGDRLLVDLRFYEKHTPQPGNLILFRNNDVIMMKRVAAIEGSAVRASNAAIFINEKPLEGPYVHTAGHSLPEIDNFNPINVPKAKLFVLGDNLDLSLDSRSKEIGLVDSATVMGKPLYVFMNPNMPDRWGVPLH